MIMQSQITIVIPLYNEQDVLPKLIDKLNNIISNSNLLIDILFVNDGSTDNTSQIIEHIATSDYRFSCINFSRNFGHQNAVTAGLHNAKGSEAVMIIDGDLQDPPDLVFDFYYYISNGYEIVNAIRKKRKENFVKRCLYWSYYRFLNRISSIQLTLDSGDFCMINRKVVDLINSLPENNRYIRGIRSWVGFNQYNFEYERLERKDGASKYSYKMLFDLAYNGIFSFSRFPIKFITRLGILTVLVSFLYILILVFYKIFLPNVVPKGFTTLTFFITIFSGVQLTAVGIVGEYMIRIYDQVKNRPSYIVKSKIIDGEKLL
jgi:glycosyltransferase involved in cell wall biosynthesis